MWRRILFLHSAKFWILEVTKQGPNLILFFFLDSETMDAFIRENF
jgi:hypothetical protein